MAGLLDAFNSPEFQRGMFMLAAARPQSEQSRAGLLSYMDNQEQAKLKRGLLEMQIEDKKLEREIALAAQQRQQDAIGALNRAIAGDQTGVAEGSPSQESASTRSQNRGGIANLTAEQVLAAEMSGIKGVREMWNDARTGIERKPNTYYEVNGQTRHYADPEKGLTVDSAGNVGVMPGYANAQAQIAAAKILAEQQALLPFDIARYQSQNQAGAQWRESRVLGPDGSTMVVPSAQALYPQRFQPAPMGAPAGYRTEGQMRTTANEQYGNTRGDYAREIQAIQRDLNSPNLSASDKKLLSDELGRLQALSQRAAPGGPTNKVDFSPQEKAQQEAERIRAAGAAETDVQRERDAPKEAKRKEAAIQQADRMMLKVDQAMEKVGSFTTGYGANLSSIPGTKARNLSADLQTIKANLGFAELQAMREASPTGGALGAVATQELEALQSTVASLDQTQSPAQLRRNLQEIRTRYSNWKAAVNEANAAGTGTEATPTKANAKSFRDYGYNNAQAMIRDAQNTVMRNPGARAEVQRRLAEAGLSLPSGATGSW